jgi:hypothetical protein
MARVYIFGAVVLVILGSATYLLFLSKLGQKLFEKKEKKDVE